MAMTAKLVGARCVICGELVPDGKAKTCSDDCLAQSRILNAQVAPAIRRASQVESDHKVNDRQAEIISGGNSSSGHGKPSIRRGAT